MADAAQRPPSRRAHREAGYALLTVLVGISALLPLAAFALMQARGDAVLQTATRQALEAFRVAESGLEHALADLAADPRFERLAIGPDGHSGTGDDGEYPFAAPPPAFFPRAPFRYQVRVAPDGADRVDVIAWGFGHGAAVHAVAASIARTAEAWVPAALTATAPAVDLDLGADYRVLGEPGPSGTAALAVGAEDTSAALRARLPADAATRLIGRGGTPSIATARLPELGELLDAALRRVDGTIVGGTLQGDIGHGLFISPGSVQLTAVRGDGILVVGGTVEIGGDSAFAGLVVALGGVRVEAGSRALLNGAVLSGGALALRGAGEIRYDRAAIEQVGRQYSGLLPHRVRVAGWREWPEAAP